MTLDALKVSKKSQHVYQLKVAFFYSATRPPCNTISLEPEAWLEIKVKKMCLWQWAFDFEAALRVNNMRCEM